MLAVGAGLFAWYQKFSPDAELAAQFAANSNYVFPTWIVHEVPMGVSGLILAGAFAAAIHGDETWTEQTLRQRVLGAVDDRHREGLTHCGCRS